MIAVHLEDGVVRVVDAPRPATKKGYALIRMRVAGICNTDIELKRGYYRFRGRPGHEFVGDVVECSSARWRGMRVVGEINMACRRCRMCELGLLRHCPKRTVLGIVKYPGAFAEYLTLPVENLHEVPAGVADEVAVFTEPVAAACEIIEQVDMEDGTRVAVLGDGKLGLLVAQVLRVCGADVVLYGRHPEKLRIAERAGVETHIAAKLPRKEYALTVEATGSAEGLAAAVAMTEPRGTVVMKSTVHGTVAIDTARVVVDEITLVGSRCGRFEPALALLASGKVRVREMISDEFPLREAPRAFARAEERGVLKVLLRG